MNTSNVMFWFIGSACILAAMIVVVGVVNNLDTGTVSTESSYMWLAVCLALGLVMVGGWMWIGTAVSVAEDASDEWDAMDDDTPGGPLG